MISSIIETRPLWSALSMKMVILLPTKNNFTNLGTSIGLLLGIASCLSCFVFFFLTKRRLQERRMQLSDKTYKMHRNLVMGLLVQVKRASLLVFFIKDVLKNEISHIALNVA